MNKARIFSLIAGSILVVAGILVALGFNAAPAAHGAAPVAIGFGDLRRYEGQAFNLYTGMGDLQRFEAQLSLSNSGESADGPQIGMGDLHKFEAVQAGLTARK